MSDRDCPSQSLHASEGKFSYRTDILPCDAENDNVAPTAVATKKKWGLLLIMAGGAFVLSIMAAIGGFVNTEHVSLDSTRAGDTTALSGVKIISESDLKEKVFEVTFQSEYSDDDGWLAYPFLSNVHLVEPMRKTKVSVRPGAGLTPGHVITSCGFVTEVAQTNKDQSTTTLYDNIYGVERLADFQATMNLLLDVDMAGEFFSGYVYFPQPATFSATTTCELSNKGQLVNVRSQVEIAECLYVRREMRRLTDEDRNDFFDALLRLYKITRDEAKQQYPDQPFQSMHELISKHTALVTYDKHEDHLHNGLGFLTHHMALTSSAETALQVINPRVSMPYWDFTIDGQWMKKDKARTVSDSVLFTKDWFGKFNTEEHTVTEGRWAYLKVPMQSPIDDIFHPNAYGHLRAPWNLNESPYLTRYVSGCGAQHTGALPSCGAHLDLVQNYDSWTIVGMNIKFGNFHDNAHLFVAGYGGSCTNVSQETVNFVGKNLTDALYQISNKILIWMWRYNLIETPVDCVPGEPCEFKCTKNVSGMSTIVELFLELQDYNSELESWKTKSNSDKIRSFEMLLCDKKVILGDGIDAGGANDPTFWVIHPTVERLYQYKDLVKPMTDRSWPPNGTSLCTPNPFGSQCKGHHAYDQIAFMANLRNKKDSYEMRQPTNHEYLRAMTPTSGEYALPYVYDNFRWTHCEMDGFYFPEVNKTRA